MYNYDTVSEAINDLAKRGYTTDFKLFAGKDCIVCDQTQTQLSPDEFEIDETYRFEGNTDPGDEMIVFAISAKKHNMKGILVDAYGMYSDSASTMLVEKLKKHIETRKPIRRSEFLKPLSQEHHHALLLSWKIRKGLANGVATERIRKYADWFYTHHLLPHFSLEEKYAFPVLGEKHPMVRQALQEHQKLHSLFGSPVHTPETLQEIATVLEKHIRFEERVLFNAIQEAASEEQMDQIRLAHDHSKFADNTSDMFWK